ncbi:3-oxosteroid 1-dehydrogenase [Nocardioides daejeonensis]|uniref:3-oxosteroid 1-dehydrogenase n=1 Tax=Nocardioides daejeonensis TaxID=1046556 RepID=UPI000D7456E0|nr:3-oxosteroid 1-dehydrogenase [Nocardioides daejeonensis]
MSEETVDVVVVGSGAAGLSAAITAAASGLEVVILEKSHRWGGTTARSGGGVWVPGNDFLKPAPDEQPGEARRYLDAIVDGVDPGRLDAYVERGPEALRFLTRHSALDLAWVRGYADYHPEQPGGRPAGRSCEPTVFDAHRLGELAETLEPFYTKAPMNVVVKQADYRWLSTGLRHWRGPWHMLKVGMRTLAARLRGRRIIGLGQALCAQLMIGVRDLGIPLRLGVAMTGLLVEDGRVVGVRTSAGVLRARRGVVLACGGFDHNADLRALHQREPAGPELSLGVPTNTGDGILAATAIGADTALMDDAWWAPSIPLPRGPWFALAERSLPGGIIVNERGERFMNESLPYVEATHRMFGGEYGAGDGPAENLPCWLVFDQTYRKRYLFAGITGGAPLPKKWLASGAITKAATVPELAAAIGVPEDGLTTTVERFNGFARAGVDADFHRGESAYDHYYGDLTNRPNPSLAPLARGPFYAARMVPADLGTKGGVLTDARARALDPHGAVIPGLYAAGNTSAAVMGHTYAGPGATIGPAMVFGYLAALDCAAAVSAPPAG